MEDLNEIEKSEALTTGLRNKLFIYILICMALNLILVPFTQDGPGQGRHLSGKIATPDEVVEAAIKTIIFGMPLIGFILGTVASLFPYKKIQYSKKYLHFSLILILVLETVALILSVMVLFKLKF